jgi:hypothetical protein
MPRDGAITMTKAKSERMDQSPPDAALLQLLGYVTLAWSTVDEMLTAALFSLLSIDKFEFTILIGKIEFPTKLAKLDQILSHRKDKPRLKFVQKLKTEMDNLRGDRNALTHGVYQGKSDRGEFFFMVPLDIIFDKGYDDPAYKLRVFTLRTISDHVEKALAIGTDIAKHFDAAKWLSYVRHDFTYQLICR